MVIINKKTKSRLLSLVVSFILVFALTLPMAISVFAASSGPPGVVSLAHNQWAGDVDGNYDLTWNMWYGNNATSWKLYEKVGAGEFNEISSEKLTDQTPTKQNGIKEIRGKTVAGTYSYYVVLINQYGESKSNIVSVVVGTPTGDIILTGIDINPAPVNQFTIKQGTTEISINFLAAQNPTFKVSTNNNLVINCSIVNGTTLKVDGLKAGRASIKIHETSTNTVRFVGVRVKNSDGTLPGMPEYLSIGSVSEDKIEDLEFWRDFENPELNKRSDIRYIYINGGPIAGWKKWTDVEGDRARKFIKESLKLGMIPYFVYYNIPDDGESYERDLAHIQDTAYMEAYYKDLKYLLQICKEEAGDELVGLVFEPDFLGYMMQQSKKQPNQIEAKASAAYSSGVLSASDVQFSNNVEGLVKSINYTVNKYYPEAYYGWQFNLWAYEGPGVSSKGILQATELLGMEEGIKAIRNAAKQTCDYYMSAGIATYGADFVSIDKYGLDGGAMPGAPADPKNSVWFWNADIWNNYLEFVKEMGKETKLPVILWQIPVGHINSSQEPNPYKGGLFPDLNGKDTKYEDSAPVFFLGDTFKPGSGVRHDYFKTNKHNDKKISSNGDTVTWGSHMQETKDAGVISILFGAGVNSSTDGVGSPPTDDYWWIHKVQKYLKNPIMLDGSTPIETVLTPVFSPNSGTYKTAQNVTISCATVGATIRYTTDGTEPNGNSSVYNEEINVSKTTTIKAKAFKSNMKDSSTAIAIYKIGDETPIETILAPVFNPDGGTYKTAQNVTISCATSGAEIRYTLDGTQPTGNSPVYNGEINISKTTTIKAKAYKEGMTDSATTTATYTISIGGGVDKGNPSGTPSSPAITHNNWDGRASYDIKFNIWWGNNATSYKLFENDIMIETDTLEANSPNAQSKTFTLSNKASGTYTYKIELENSYGKTMSSSTTVTVSKGSSTPIDTVVIPVFSPVGGTYNKAQNVTISCATVGATIRYTTDGSEPTANSSVYNKAISVTKNTILKAKAFKTGFTTSATSTANYIIDSGAVEPNSWKPYTPYKQGDIATYNNKTFECRQPHTSLPGWEPTNAAALWKVK